TGPSARAMRSARATWRPTCRWPSSGWRSRESDSPRCSTNPQLSRGGSRSECEVDRRSGPLRFALPGGVLRGHRLRLRLGRFPFIRSSVRGFGFLDAMLDWALAEDLLEIGESVLSKYRT